MFGLFRKQARLATINPAGSTLTVEPGKKLLEAALEAGLDWPHDCRVGSCGTCKCYLKSGKIKPLRDFMYTLEVDDINAGAILACQSLLKSDVTVEITLKSDEIRAGGIEHHHGVISHITSLTHDILAVTITTPDAPFKTALAGQYAELTIDAAPLPRSYSFASPPNANDSNDVQFYIRHVPGGEFTDWLFSQDRNGSTVEIAGPYGNFHQHESRHPMICVAGGSGLAPIRALIEAGISNKLNRDIVVLFGARTQADLYCMEDLQALGDSWNGSFKLIPVLSEEPDDGPSDEQWPGARGFVTDELDRTISANTIIVGDCQAYLCGPPPMIDAAIAVLTAQGMPQSNIFFDKFEDASTLARKAP
jgi:toluene methyl-monooxygenase electron transfer component